MHIAKIKSWAVPNVAQKRKEREKDGTFKHLFEQMLI